MPPLEGTVVYELIRWHLGDAEELDPQTKSALGFDDFNYYINARCLPSQEQFDALKAALVQHALDHPELMLYHIFHETLAHLMAGQCAWAIYGRVKTLAYAGHPWETR